MIEPRHEGSVQCAWAVALIGVACDGPETTPAQPPPARASTTEVASPPADDPPIAEQPPDSGLPDDAAPDIGCRFAAGATVEPIELSVNSAASVASGMQVHFVGTTQDHYEDGGFAVLVEFAFTWGDDAATEIVNGLAPTEPPEFRPMLDHCWRLAELTQDGVVVEVAVASDPGATLPKCGPTDPNDPLPTFGDYHDVADGARFTATLRYDDDAHDWAVSPTPKFVQHHATRIDWANLDPMGRAGLGLARGSDVRARFRFDSTEITKAAGRRQWLSRHTATLESVCLP